MALPGMPGAGLGAALGSAKKLLLLQPAEDFLGGVTLKQLHRSLSTPATSGPSPSLSMVTCSAAGGAAAAALATPGVAVIDALGLSLNASMCAPPRTAVGVRRLTAPATSFAVAASKTKRRCRKKGGGGGDDALPEDGDGGGPFDGGDEGSGGGGGDDGGSWDGSRWDRHWGDDGGHGSQGGLSDLFFLWKTVCLLSFLQSVQYLQATLQQQPGGRAVDSALAVCGGSVCPLQAAC